MSATNGHEPTYEDLQAQVAELRELYGSERNQSVFLAERLAELELALEDVGWQKLGEEAEDTFSREGLDKIIRISRYSYRKNPLINHAVSLGADYVMGQGVNVKAQHEEINEVVQDFWADPDNQRVLTSSAALRMNDRELRVTGNRFFALFSDQATGAVQVRAIPVDEVRDIITDPEDRSKPWYYKRVWRQRDPETGELEGQPRTAYYPDIHYRPTQPRPQRINDAPIYWDSPVHHMAVGQLDTDLFGIPEIYPALDWARAVKEDLEDWASIRRAHARFAAKITTRGGKAGVTQARTKLGTTLGTPPGSARETNPPPLAGSAFIAAMDAQGSPLVDYQPIRLAGMSPDPDEGRRLGLMVAAGVGIPETMLFGNADVGNLATAETLDRPTELKMRGRQEDWETTLRTILDYVIDRAILAPRGRLKALGKLAPDPRDPRQQIVIMNIDPLTGEPYSRHVDLDFPNVLDRDPKDRVQPIVEAETLGTQQRQGLFRDELLARLLYQALGVDDIDEELALLLPQGDDADDEEQLNLVREIRALRESIERGMGRVA